MCKFSNNTFFLHQPFSLQCTLSGLIAHSISTTSLPDRYINYHPHTKPIPGRHCGRVVVDPLFYFLHPFRPRKQQNSNWLCSNRMQQDKSVLFFFFAWPVRCFHSPNLVVLSSRANEKIVLKCAHAATGKKDTRTHTATQGALSCRLIIWKGGRIGGSIPLRISEPQVNIGFGSAHPGTRSMMHSITILPAPFDGCVVFWPGVMHKTCLSPNPTRWIESESITIICAISVWVRLILQLCRAV